ncbi:MAG: hypothetical protein HW387_268 [Parachlamydiales bacterium]|nr:hypothetical protein [Parachlamydiales bacterium]
MRFLIAFAFSLALTACSHKGSDLTRFHEDGRAKPIVTVASVIDATSFDLPWSLSEELTTMFVSRLSQGGSIFVSRNDNIAYTENPFSPDLSWMKREFPTNEFVVFLELAEHENVAIAKGNKKVQEVPFETSIDLKMGVRIRVVDLRGTTPQIVLQELVRDSYYIPKTLLPTDYTVAVWGTDEYSKSPLGIAHTQIVEELATRIGEYIHLAKSR